jgi:transposase
LAGAIVASQKVAAEMSFRDGMRRPTLTELQSVLLRFTRSHEKGLTMKKHITETIGCDIGDKYSHLCVLDAMGEVKQTASIKTSPAGFRKWFAGRAPSVTIIEVGTHSRWVEIQLKRLGHEVVVANARQVRLIYAGTRKNDRIDAEKLARLGRADRKLLCPIRHRGQEAQTDLMVLRSREQLVKTRTQLMNHVRGVAKSFGLRISKGYSPTFCRRARELLSTELLAAVEPILSCIEEVSKRIKQYEQTITKMANECGEAQGILSIHGVGELTAMAYILTLEEPTRVKRRRDVGAYLGLVPRERQTGNSDPQLRISKAGDGFVRKLLVNCAQRILGPFGQDSDLRRYGLRLMERGGKNAKKKAVIAVARKLAVLMHRLWVTGEVYDPLHGQTAVAAAV